jgi:O-succinylbenzoic acid--CoA ligase
LDLATVRERVAERLGRPAAPRRMVVVAELPLLANGKPDRMAVRVLAAGGSGSVGGDVPIP